MIVKRENFKVIADNDENYFQFLEAVVSSIDNNSSLSIVKNPNSYSFKISPSKASLINSLIEELLSLHNILHIQMNMSKSIKTSSSISWKIEI